jgi:hypothetical protein
MTKSKSILLSILLLVVLSWGVYECKYYYSYYSDLKDRPWAYSEDKNTKLLVGKWNGSFKDPDGVQKTLVLQIFEPVTEEERKEKASRYLRNRRGLGSRENKRAFEGVAVVTSRLGKEDYEIYGSVKKEDFHHLSFNFRPQDEKKRVLPNFTLAEAKEGTWQNDELRLTLTFSYHKADGSSFWNSADSRHDKTAETTLIRQKSE